MRTWLFARDALRDRAALLEDDRLVEYYEERRDDRLRRGSIFAATVRDVVPALAAAFVEISPGEKAFLQQKTPGATLRRGERVLVQLTQGGRAAKAPQVSTELKLPGRYLVLTPGSDQVGVSKKITDEGRREELRALVTGAIVRSRAQAAPDELITTELKVLESRLQQIQEDFRKNEDRAALLYEEVPLPLRLLRDRVEDGDRVLTCDKALATMQSSPRPELFVGDATELFASADIEGQLREASARRVVLPGGGSIVVDYTEALTAIDVNSASTTAIRTNYEAAVAAAHQIRLRNIAGIIIVDFIEMQDPEDRAELMRVFARELSRDPARIWLLPLDEFGLAKLTRKGQ